MMKRRNFLKALLAAPIVPAITIFVTEPVSAMPDVVSVTINDGLYTEEQIRKLIECINKEVGENVDIKTNWTEIEPWEIDMESPFEAWDGK